MQFLLNKGQFKFGLYRKAEAYNPFAEVLIHPLSLLLILKTEEVNYSLIENVFQAERLNLFLQLLF